MMRYILWLTPLLALFAGYALAALLRFGRTPLAAATAVVLLYALQLSASYVLPLSFAPEPRREVVRRLAADDPRAVVGVTASFAADRTYQPRFPADTEMVVMELRLFEDFDVERVFAGGPPWIVTTDFARQHAWKQSAIAFEERLRSGPEYERTFDCGPPWRPLRLADLFGWDRPDDLLYVRLTFEVFRRGSP
jgi:hypothetical protein